MKATITTSCRSGDTRYTRLNLLGWAMLCPHAMDLLWHGSTPLGQPNYPTADESSAKHDRLREVVEQAFNSPDMRIISRLVEYQHMIGFIKKDEILCARSKADLIYILKTRYGLMNTYIEIASTRINIAKPWQALLRGIALYYEWRLPTAIIIVSPYKIMYKLLRDHDQEKVLARINRGYEDFEPTPNLCSLCELANYCPYRAI